MSNHIFLSLKSRSLVDKALIETQDKFLKQAYISQLLEHMRTLEEDIDRLETVNRTFAKIILELSNKEKK